MLPLRVFSIWIVPADFNTHSSCSSVFAADFCHGNAQGEDLVVDCYYIDSAMNAFAISPAQVTSTSLFLFFGI
jgi:hypothetical protein